ncbi:MAG TPA: SDR family oxidoreductase [Acidimicrobiales bacterium]|nr:SDR family oxidoreductase [Acidimicrobiales bacterium]
MPVAIVTGASKGLGRALAAGLAHNGWSLVIDARHADDLRAAEGRIRAVLDPHAGLVAVTGDVTDPAHRRQLVAAARELGGLDLVVNNAGTLGPSPLPSLTDLPLPALRDALEANLVAPLALVQEAAEALDESPAPRVVNLTSDASVEAYPGWGGYGVTKAALDHLSAVLAAERPAWKVWAFDPGDMRTQMHQDAFPGEDISDRPEPESVVPALLALIGSERPSGRVRASESSGVPA